jgi:hypothetical protein
MSAIEPGPAAHPKTQDAAVQTDEDPRMIKLQKELADCHKAMAEIMRRYEAELDVQIQDARKMGFCLEPHTPK